MPVSSIVSKIRDDSRLRNFLKIELLVRGIEVKTFIPLPFTQQLGIFLDIVNTHGLNVVVHDLGFKVYRTADQNTAYDNIGAYLWMDETIILYEYRAPMKIHEETGTGELDSKRKPVIKLFERALFVAIKMITYGNERKQ